MMHDPLAEHLDGDPYGSSRSFAVLSQLFHSAHPDALAAAAEIFLKRLALLEMALEDRGVTISEPELKAFLEQHQREVDDETHKLAQLLFGRVATREGG